MKIYYNHIQNFFLLFVVKFKLWLTKLLFDTNFPILNKKLWTFIKLNCSDVRLKKYSKLNNIYFVNYGILTENYALVNIIHD